MIAMVGTNLSLLVGVERAAQVTYLAGLGGDLAVQLREAGFNAACLDEQPDLLAATERSGVLSSGHVIDAVPMRALLRESGCRALLPFKSGPQLWATASELELPVLASPDQLVRKLENKLQLPALAEAAGVLAPATKTVRLDSDLLALMREQTGGGATAGAVPDPGAVTFPAVFQPATGFSGAGTWPLATIDDLEALIERSGGRTVGKLTQRIDGAPLTINGVVLGDAERARGARPTIVAGRPARQLTGLPGLTPAPLGSCGNDWALHIDDATVDACRAIAFRVGAVLASRGHRGVFGIDVVAPYDGADPVLIEINPRWTASLSLQVQLQHARGLPTLLDAHLHAFGMGNISGPDGDGAVTLDDVIDTWGDGEAAGTPTIGARTTPPACATVIVYHDGADLTLAASSETSGRWAPAEGERGHEGGYEGGYVTRTGPGWRLDQLPDHGNDVLVLAPPHGRVICHGDSLLRVTMRGQAVGDEAACTLLPVVDALVRAMVAHAVTSPA